MKVKKITDLFKRIAFLGLVLVFTLISINVVNANPIKKEDETNQRGIVGVWQLDQASADKNSKKSNPTLLPLPIMFAPESLILATDEDVREITINEGFKEFIHTQTLPTDGTVVTKNVQPIGQVFAKAYWKDKKLIVEFSTSRGEKMTQVFELSSNQKKLNVTLQFNDSSSDKTLKVKRVYNRLSDKVEETTAEFGISELPL